MSGRPHSSERAAAYPPATFPGLDAGWSRVVTVPGRGVDAGRRRGWHLLDNGPALTRAGRQPVGTVLAVHGNPYWSFHWRALLGRATADALVGLPAWRVIAVDHLEMGFSERSGIARDLRQRIADLSGLTGELGLEHPVVTLGHDWGGPISLGWAVAHRDAVAGVVLLNTAVHQSADVPIPAPLRLVLRRGVLGPTTARTSAFLTAALSLARPALASNVAAAYHAPYLSPARRAGIRDFVADIPATPDHRSSAPLAEIAEAVRGLAVPALLLWGPHDPIFSDRYLADLIERLPQAQVHRYEGAGHLLAEDAPYASAVLTWLRTIGPADGAATPVATRPAEAVVGDGDVPVQPFWQRLDDRSTDPDVAVIDMAPPGGGPPRRVSWRLLAARVRDLAAGLSAFGVRRGDRVHLLVPPGPTLIAVVYACLRIGAVVVVADAALGVRGLGRAITGAWPDYVVGGERGLAAARALGWPGVRISATRLRAGEARVLGVRTSVPDLIAAGRGAELPAPPGPRDPAAVLFTSGSTGPAKGVVYTHAQLAAVRDVLTAHFAISPDTGLVTGFAPFALLGPALGTRSATPDMDVSAPRTLTARAVADAVAASDARMVFLSPAAVRNVVATVDDLDDGDRSALARVDTVLSTGAPISEALLASIADLMPHARAHTPYGMTECLLVADIDLAGIRAAADAPDDGVCVGRPIEPSRVLVSALDPDGRATGHPTASAGVLGEILVSAPHLKERYDRLWLTDQESGRGTAGLGRWHRTGDVGHLDGEGRVWVEGRLQHVLVTADGLVAPVGPELQIERVPGVRRAAVVGVGPRGTQQAVAVIVTVPGAARAGLADPGRASAVRAGVNLPLAAVLVVRTMPTDIRHNSKVDRSRLGAWADRLLAGQRVGAP